LNPTLLSLPAAPSGESYALSTSVDPFSLDLVVSAASAASWIVTSGTGSWAASGNWSPATVPTSGTATFAGATAPVTVTLDGPQAVGALVFNSTGGNGYTLSQGTGGALTLGTPSGASIAVVSGTHTISAPIVLEGNLTVSATAGGALDLSGSVSDGGAHLGLTLSGNGALILSGTGSYTGGTTVAGGTLYLTNSTAILAGTSLTVGAGGTFDFDPSVTASPVQGVSAGVAAVSPAGGVAAVPEPGTLGLLAAAGILAVAAAGRRRRSLPRG
jgi:autotransporter-associated beta strand protein